MKSGSAVSSLCILYESDESMLAVSRVPKHKLSSWALSSLKHQIGCAEMVQKDKVGGKRQQQGIIMFNAFGQDRHFWAIWLDADVNQWWAEQAKAALCWEKGSFPRSTNQGQRWGAVGNTKSNIADLGSQI